MKILLSCLFVIIEITVAAQSIGIGTNSPNASAQLDVTSTTKGLLLPRMTLVQRNAIAAPAAGLLIYQTDNTPGFYHYNGAAWVQLSTGSATNYWTLAGTNISNNNAGNVGIGTSAPAYDLDITRSAPSIGFFDAGKNHFSGYITGDSTDIEITAYRKNTLATNEPGNLILQMNSNSILQQLAAGNVGIGMRDPFYKLSLNGDQAIYNGSNFIGFLGNEGTDFLIQAKLGNLFAGTSPENLILQYTGTAGNTSGRVGIGTNTPEDKLHIAGSSTTKLILGRSHTSGGYTALYMGTSALSNGYAYLQGVRSGGLSFGNIIINESGGNMGVGTNNPLVKLHVNGSGEALRVSNGNAATQIYSDGFQFTNSSGAGRFFMEFNSDNFTIAPSTGNTAGNLILEGNQVTIGQIAPATGYKLSVGGKAICEELKVQLRGAWPDYVFKNDYRLKTFDELRQYISQYSHLPNIPAAAEMEKNGVEVGEMQRKMMEKIEELTLYILQLEKEMKDIKKQLAQTK